MTTLEDLAGRDFATVAETAEVLQLDPRSARKAIAEGQLPGVRVGNRVLVPVARLRALAALPEAPEEPPAPAVNPEALCHALETVRAAMAAVEALLAPGGISAGISESGQRFTPRVVAGHTPESGEASGDGESPNHPRQGVRAS